MLKLKINKSFLFIVLSAFSSAFAINIRYIKDTYSILKPEFKHLSPAHGPIWWEKNLAENNFKYAGDPLAKNLFNVPQAAPGAPQIEDFALAAAESSPATYFTPYTVGLLIGAIERMRAEILQAQERIAAIQQKKAPAPGQLSAKQIAAKKEVTALAAKLKKDLIITLQDDVSYQDRIKAYLATLPAGDQKVAQSTINSLLERKVIPAVLSSLTLSGFFELIGDLNNLMYVPYQTYFILQAFLYRKAQEVKEGKNVGKEDFKAYFDGLVQKLGPDIFTQAGATLLADPAWMFDVFENTDRLRLEIAESIQAMQALDRSFVDQFYEAMVCAELSKPQGLPKIAEYRSGTRFMGQSFTNCADNLVRNLCNIAMYNKVANTFTFERIDDANPSPEAVHFYATFNNADDIESEEIHNAWNLVVQNRQYVAYEQIFDIQNPAARARVGDQDFKGFILQTDALKPYPFAKKRKITFKDDSIKEFPEFELNGEVFVLVDPNQYAVFEVEPTIRNIVILMNEILGLRLYDDIAGVFLDADFNKKYCLRLFERFGWSLSDPINFIAEKIKAQVMTENGSFILYLSWGHGEISIINTNEVKEYQKRMVDWQLNALEVVLHAQQSIDLKTFNNFMKNSLSMNLFALYYYNSFDYSEYFKRYKPITLFKSMNYFIQPLRQSIAKLRFIEKIINTQEIDFYPFCIALIDRLDVGADLFYLKQLLKIDFTQIRVEHPEIISAIRNKCDVLFERPITKDSIETAQELIKQDIGIEKVILFAQKLSQAPENIGSSLDLLNKLVQKRHAFDLAQEVASHAMDVENVHARENVHTRIYALKVFEQLIAQGVVSNAAVVAAQKGVERSAILVPGEAMELWKELFKKGIGFETATHVVQNLFKKEPALAIQLLTLLVQNNREYQTALQIVQRIVKQLSNLDIGLQEMAIELLTEVVKKGQGINIAEEVVRSILNLDRAKPHQAYIYEKLQESTFKLMGELIEQGTEMQGAIRIASDLLKSEKFKERESGYYIFQKLARQAQFIHESLQVAQNALDGVYGGSFSDQVRGFQILEQLVLSGNMTAYEDIHRMLQKYLEVSPSIVLDLYRELIARNYQPAYNDAADSARQFENSKSERIQEAVQQLLQTLKEKGIE